MRMGQLHQSALVLRAELERRLLKGDPPAVRQAEEASGEGDGDEQDSTATRLMDGGVDVASPPFGIPSTSASALATEALSSGQALLSQFVQLLSRQQGKNVSENHRAILAAAALPIYELLATCR